MTAWADFTSALNASLGIGDVLHAASSILRQIFGFDQTIMVVVGPRGDLTAMRTLPERPDSVEGFRLERDHWLVARTLGNGAEFWGDPNANGGIDELAGHDRARSVTALPLIAPDGRVGCLVAVSLTDDFDVRQIKTSVTNAAREIATASDRVVNFERSRLQAITDPLTELYNRRYFTEALRNEIRKAQRLGYPLGLFMIDIDDFKLVNDTYGHLAGDDVLKSVANWIERSVRASDLVARFGGEEFVVVVVGCPEDELVVLAEKVRAAVEDVVVEAARPERKNVTVSIGAAYFGDVSMSAEDLISRADGALYDAKGSGKNRVVVSEQAVA